MKKIYLGFALVSILASCGNTKNEEQLQSKQYTIDSFNAVAVQKEADRRTAEERRAVKRQNAVYQPVSTGAATTTTTTPATPAKKKGWSNVAKGAVIGGVVGAGTGVAVSKNKVKGGIIGGVVGAAAGAGVGAVIDKKKN